MFEVEYWSIFTEPTARLQTGNCHKNYYRWTNTRLYLGRTLFKYSTKDSRIWKLHLHFTYSWILNLKIPEIRFQMTALSENRKNGVSNIYAWPIALYNMCVQINPAVRQRSILYFSMRHMTYITWCNSL